MVKSSAPVELLDIASPSCELATLKHRAALLEEKGDYQGALVIHKLMNQLYKKMLAAAHHDKPSWFEEYWQTHVEDSPDPVIIVAQGRIIKTNQQTQKLLKRPSQMLNGQDFCSLCPPEHTDGSSASEQIWQIFSQALDGTVLTKAWSFTLPAGELIHCEMRVEPFPLASDSGLKVTLKDVTWRRQMEAELREQNFLFTQLIDNLTVSIYATDRDGKVILWNKNCELLWNLTADEVLGKTIAQVFPKERAEYYRRVDDVVNELQMTEDMPEEEVESEILGLRYIKTQKTPVFDHLFRPLYMISISRDVTEDRLIHNQFRQNEEKLKAIFNTALVGLAILDKKGHFQIVNQHLCNLLGYNEVTMLSMNKYDIVAQPHVAANRNYFFKLLTGKNQNYTQELELLNIEGQTFWASLSAAPIYDIYGMIESMMWIIVDIDEAKRANQQLKISENRYRTIFNTAATPSLIVEANARILLVNKQFELLSGYSALELQNIKQWSDFIHEEDLPLLLKAHRQLRQDRNRAAHNLDFRFVNRQGLVHYLSMSHDLIPGTGRSIISLLDITDLKAGHQRLKEQNLFMSTLIDTLPSPLYYKDTEGLYLGCNRSFESELGVLRGQLMGKTAAQIMPAALAAEEIKKDQQLINSGGVQKYETQLLYTDNTRHDVMQYKATYKNSEGQIAGLIGVILDITERKTQEQRLRLAYDKLDLLARTDPLTKLSNRRDMLKRLSHEQDRNERSHKPFCLILCDIDHFKKFNDTYGHDGGDFVLVEVSKILKAAIRKQDLVARWGGEEFLILLPETTIDGALYLAEQMRAKIEESTYLYNEQRLSITMSFGLSSYNYKQDIDEIIKQADEALYQSKFNGRNQVCCK